MTPRSRGLVVIDTGVFAARLTPSGNLLAARYRPVLEGRPAVISFVTVAELGYGARLACLRSRARGVPDWFLDRPRSAVASLLIPAAMSRSRSTLPCR